MKDKKSITGNFLICVIMASLGFAFSPEKDSRYSFFMVIMAFVSLLFFIMQVSRSKMRRPLKTAFIFLISAAEMLWLRWAGISPDSLHALLFIGASCIAFLLLSILPSYFRQRLLVSRWNTAYAAWKAGSSPEEYLKEVEGCQSALESCSSVVISYGGIPLKDYIAVHKIFLLKEMGRTRECLELLNDTLPKIRNPEVRKALSDAETDLSDSRP